MQDKISILGWSLPENTPREVIFLHLLQLKLAEDTGVYWENNKAQVITMVKSALDYYLPSFRDVLEKNRSRELLNPGQSLGEDTRQWSRQRAAEIPKYWKQQVFSIFGSFREHPFTASDVFPLSESAAGPLCSEARPPARIGASSRWMWVFSPLVLVQTGL